MISSRGKFENKTERKRLEPTLFTLSLTFFLIELFSFFYLRTDGSFTLSQLWPLAFGALWSVILGSLLRLLPRKAARILYGLLFALCIVYSVGQSGYYQMFSEMMWISEFRYASEGSDYFDVLLSYPVSWFLCILGLLLWGGFHIWRFPRWESQGSVRIAGVILAAFAAVCAAFLPQLVFLQDGAIRYAASDYGRSDSAEAAYENMFNAHRLYEICGIYQTAVKDVYTNFLYPITPGFAAAQLEAEGEIAEYFAENNQSEDSDNAMTGLFQGKDVVLVLMESMDDWLLGEHTPTINRLMEEGMNFTNFYTPVYGGIRTFNTEFCINTGSFLSSAGGYAFDYVTNDYSQSLASQLEEEGYSAKTFHYNDPSFYSRGVFSVAMGYEEYVCYADYLDEGEEKRLYDDQLLFDEEGLSREFFRDDAPTLNFIITRSAHLSYKYNEVLSHWGLQKYPEYKGLTGNEEEDCAYLKAKLVDDMFARLLEELEAEGKLQDTVIIAVTDHYTYGVKDENLLYNRSGVEEELLLEKTPCFIWSADMQPLEVDKTLNTSDLLPTVLNLMDVQTEDDYIGQDAFDADYEGFVPFSDGSWITSDVAYDAGEGKIIYLSEDVPPVTEEFLEEMEQQVGEFIYINNLILETDYYES